MFRLMFLLVFSFLIGCNQSEQVSERQAAQERENQNWARPINSRSDADATQQNQQQMALTDGLPSFCKEITGDEEHHCFACEISEINIARCITKREGFSLTKNCNHDALTLQCKADGALVHQLSLVAPSELQIIQFFPVVSNAAKVLIAAHLAHKKKEKTVTHRALDFIGANIKEFMTYNDSTALHAKIMDFIAKQYSYLKTEEGEEDLIELNDERRAQISDSLHTALSTFRTKRLQNQLHIIDSLNLSKQFSGILPHLNIDEAVSGIDFKNLDIMTIIAKFLNQDQENSDSHDDENILENDEGA